MTGAGHKDNGTEIELFANAVTTNKTAFFREPHHFDFLRQIWLPERIEQARSSGSRKLRIWSAACSTGEEPYTLAMTVLDTIGATASAWDVQILATDINSSVLDRARSGIYGLDTTEDIPRATLERYFLRGTGQRANQVRVRPELRKLVTFQQLNFIAPSWSVPKDFHLVICRNALIYFDSATQRMIVERLCRHLIDDGYFILGHSESLLGHTSFLEREGNTIYRKRAGALPNSPLPGRPASKNP
ncbi:MAG: protein-glutamate O-methyltransferase CheR [Planctomycetes bacterium]|nr:protein-glutamate O-methyltransferase CheR [Planctomycetota bacterium]